MCVAGDMKILIAYDGSSHADLAIDDLQWAGLPPDSNVIIVAALADTPYPKKWTEHVAAAEQMAEIGCNRFQSHFPKSDVQLEVLTGDAAAVLLEKANAWPADLIVAGTHGRSAFGRAVLGSVSLRLVREAHCSVRVARPRNHNGPLRLLIGVDGSEEAQAAVLQVSRRCWPAGTEARVLSVHEVLVPTSGDRTSADPRLYDQINEDEHFRLQRVATAAAEKLRHAGLIVSPVVEEADPKEALVREARNWTADAIFIGGSGLGHVERFNLGGVSSATVAHAPCTVEVVRQ